MSNNFYIIEDGEVKKAASMEEWSKWMTNNEVIIRYSDFGDVVVCTAFIGRDITNSERENPQLFRTDVWVFDHAYQSISGATSAKEAMVNHEKVVSEVTKRIHQAGVIAKSALKKIQAGGSS